MNRRKSGRNTRSGSLKNGKILLPKKRRGGVARRNHLNQIEEMEGCESGSAWPQDKLGDACTFRERGGLT